MPTISMFYGIINNRFQRNIFIATESTISSNYMKTLRIFNTISN